MPFVTQVLCEFIYFLILRTRAGEWTSWFLWTNTQPLFPFQFLPPLLSASPGRLVAVALEVVWEGDGDTWHDPCHWDIGCQHCTGMAMAVGLWLLLSVVSLSSSQAPTPDKDAPPVSPAASQPTLAFLLEAKKPEHPNTHVGATGSGLQSSCIFWEGLRTHDSSSFFFDLVISSTNKLCGWQTHSPCSIGYCRLCHKNKQNKTNQPNKKNENNNNKKTPKKPKPNQNRDLGYNWRDKKLMWALACGNLASSCVWVTKARLPCVCSVLFKLRPHFPLQHLHLHGS